MAAPCPAAAASAPANSKSVSWLLGRDGDVAVIVIGEVDELKTSKIISSGFAEKKTPSLQNNDCHQKTILKSNLVHRKNTEPARTERENLPPATQQPGIPLNLKGKCEEVGSLLPLQVSVSEHASPPAAEKPELKSGSATEEKAAPQPSICSRPPMRVSHINVRPASANAGLASANTRPGLAHLKLATATTSPVPSSTAKTDSGLKSPTTAGFHKQEPQRPQESQGGKDVHVAEAPRGATSEEARSAGSAATCAGRGRVAQLMKTFSVESPTPPAQTPSRSNKPPIPSKPNHLRVMTTPSVR
ncbi:uncharacterized protein LOC115371530 isoform X2 [Myripristis murdjan]|uniref:uncharacterized protein LOC115371530 isoform X2 n=1 Tax=Myripristis murdjan TaxID=586833 RepID=UPI001175D30A|nr:uncharacterized protein LOC115371530 isoform X2 [Myripristis murdjan]